MFSNRLYKSSTLEKTYKINRGYDVLDECFFFTENE